MSIHKLYDFKSINLETEEIETSLLTYDEYGNKVELLTDEDIQEHKGFLELEDHKYVKVRTDGNGKLTDIYKSLDGINYDLYPITEEDFE